MKFSRKFIWGQDDNGSTGWLPFHIRTFDAGVAMTVAHDTLEHFDPKDDSLKAEFLAFGAMLYLRGEGEWWSNFSRSMKPDFADQVYNEVIMFIAQDGDTLPHCRARKLDDEMLEDSLTRLYDLAIKSARDEYPPEDYNIDWPTKLKDALNWMRKGYRKAAKRYNIDWAYRRGELFQHVMEAVDKKAGVEEGDIMTVQVDTNELTARVRIRDAYHGHDW